jgi:hypothetical protein
MSVKFLARMQCRSPGREYRPAVTGCNQMNDERYASQQSYGTVRHPALLDPIDQISYDIYKVHMPGQTATYYPVDAYFHPVALPINVGFVRRFEEDVEGLKVVIPSSL